MNKNILIIDNFDSFTYNLVDEFEKRNTDVIVYRNNIPLKHIKKIIEKEKFDLIIISPGPGSPSDAGISIDLIREYSGKIPLFGVCLGHQCMIEAFGGKVGKAKGIIHGKGSKIIHDGKSIYKNLENPLIVGRYHSLAGTEITKELEIVSKTDDEEVMGVRHREHFTEGVQFHPESVLTTFGGKIVENILERI